MMIMMELAKNYCKCGCGTEIAADKRYVACHHLRDPDVLKRRDETTLKRHGVTNISKRSDIKKQKSIKWLDRKDETLEKYRNTMMQRYGVDNSFKLPEVKETIQQKWKENQDEIVEKIQVSCRESFLVSLDFRLRILNLVRMFTNEEYAGVDRENKYPFKCLTCGMEFTAVLDDGMVPKCSVCFPNLDKRGTSDMEQEIANYVQSITGVPLVCGSRTIIPPLEIDMYLPERKLAIEFDGLYWHSELAGKKQSYHKHKSEMAEKAGIRMIHIFESEWVLKKKIVKARLKNLLGANRYKIYGRKCQIRNVDRKVAQVFLNKYHIQGDASASIRLGAYYKNRLVSIMTFVKARHDKGGGYELLRFASIANFTCIGTAGKILAEFERQYPSTRLITYADRRWSDGNLYFKLGFVFKHVSDPNYFYFKDDLVLKSRVQFQKHKLKIKLKEFDNTLSEWQNMKINGWNRIWDCGNMVFEKIN